MSKLFHKKNANSRLSSGNFTTCECLSICRKESELSFYKCFSPTRKGSFCHLHAISDTYTRPICLESGYCCICMSDVGGLKLNCSHMICIICLKKLIDSPSGRHVLCPVCRRRILGLPGKSS